MNVDSIFRYLQSVDTAPADIAEFVAWIGGEDALNFIKDQVSGQVPVYISSRHFFLYSMFVPNRRLAKDCAACHSGAPEIG